MVFKDLPNDIRIYFIKFFDIYMLQNYSLTYKYGLESIQKYLFYRRIINEQNKIKPTINNSFIRLKVKYLKDNSIRIMERMLPDKNKIPSIIIKINKIIDYPYKINTKFHKCYFIVISNPYLCGDKYYMYPDWNIFNTLEFDKDDYIPYC